MADYDKDQSESKQADSKKIAFRFCRECSNMLYPKEDRTSDALMFACRTCQYHEPATGSCIYRNSLKEDVAETPGNVEDVAQDPTVGDSERDLSDSIMMEDVEFEQMGETIPEMCTLCGQDILCPFCDDPSDGGIALEVDDPDAGVASAAEYEARVKAERHERHLSGAGLRDT